MTSVCMYGCAWEEDEVHVHDKRNHDQNGKRMRLIDISWIKHNYNFK